MPPLPKRLRLLLAILTAGGSGTLAVFAFAPINLWICAPIALICLFYLAWRATGIGYLFILGLFFGFSFFLGGLWWLYQALIGYIGFPVYVAFPLFAVFCLFLALFPATALALGGYLTPAGGFSRLLSFAALWTLGEWMRGWLFSGFPWLTIGYSQIPHTPLSAWAPLLGIFGVSMALLCLIAALIAVVALRGRRLIAFITIVGVLTIAPLSTRAWQWTPPAGALTVSLLQGNIKQTLKWKKGEVEQLLMDYLDMAKAAQGRVIIMPETALPMTMDTLPDGYVAALREIAAKRYGTVIAGLFLEEDDVLYNAAVALHGQEWPTQTNNAYRKHHLTPYGEYLPFVQYLKPLLTRAGIPYLGLGAGEATQAPISLPDGISAAMSICYEDIFGDELRRQLPAAHLLINLTNDAWFDGSAMPKQHLQMAQARALETGRWLVRVTNTGETAIIDRNGKIVADLPAAVRGSLTHEVRLYRGATPYVIIGDIGVAALALFLLLACWATPAVRRLRQRRRARLPT